MSVGFFMMVGLLDRDVIWMRFDDGDTRANRSGDLQT
jgi:hypothetical protein